MIWNLIISSDTDILGGTPCIAGTRIPVSAITSFHFAGYPASQIRAEYPSLEIETIEQITRVADGIIEAAGKAEFLPES